MTGRSTRVIFAAGGANLAIAVTKLGASLYTGSSAMLTEAIHSFIDTGDQGLLLLGVKRGEKPPDESHPFGYGMEVYFWSFVVALMIFALGGAVSIYEGVLKLLKPEPIRNAWVNYTVLSAGLVFEGLSFAVALREFRKTSKTSLFSAMRRSKDPSLFAVLLEDGAALVGLLIALAGVAGASVMGWTWSDGAASVGIGLLLVAVAAFLANETRSLLAGEAAPEPVRRKIRTVVERHPQVSHVSEVMTLQLGPSQILVAVILDIPGEENAQTLAPELIASIRACDERISRVFFGPSTTSRRAQANGSHPEV